MEKCRDTHGNYTYNNRIVIVPSLSILLPYHRTTSRKVGFYYEVLQFHTCARLAAPQTSCCCCLRCTCKIGFKWFWKKGLRLKGFDAPLRFHGAKLRRNAKIPKGIIRITISQGTYKECGAALSLDLFLGTTLIWHLIYRELY